MRKLFNPRACLAALVFLLCAGGAAVAEFLLHPANNPSLCMDVYANGNANGTLVIVWTCNDGANQQWAIN
jgi:hypothetical protein